MDLVIVESPTKARTLSRYLGDKFRIEASMGHLRDLPKSKMGVDVDKQFEPVYEVSTGKSKVIAKLKKEAKGVKHIYLATDPDREGEAISWHVKFLLQENGAKKKPKIEDGVFKRVTFHEITKTAILAALDKPESINMALVDAQQARRVVDRLVGYTLSPVLWKKVRRGLSAGRVQSVAVRLIVEKEAEIKAFKANEYWEIKVLTETQGKKEEFWIELYEVGNKKVMVKGEEKEKKPGVIYLDSNKVIEPIVKDLKAADYTVESVERKERTKKAYPPYTTSTLQQAAANVLGWTGKMTMSMAQELYEKGLITYHRTDSLNLSNEAIGKARDYIATTWGNEYLPDKPQIYKTSSKNAQEAHEAIRPTHIKKETLDETTNGYTSRHIKLYRLIWQRFMACQMKPVVYDQTSVSVIAVKDKASYRLKANGSVVKFLGWQMVYKGQRNEEDTILPELEAQERLTYKNLNQEQKFTQPPARFNDASLVKELERRGIGRPSTYASIISTIIARGYVERQEKRLLPTVVGETVVKFLLKNFPTIMDYDFTAEMEEDLDRISRGEKEWKKVMAAFYKPFGKTVKMVEKNAKREAVPVEETDEMCPECKEGHLVIRTGRFGKFLSCGRFPECKYTRSFTQTLEGFLCPKCKGEVVLKRTKRGRSFWGCKNYPKCDYASWQDPRKQGEATETADGAKPKTERKKK